MQIKISFVTLLLITGIHLFYPSSGPLLQHTPQFSLADLLLKEVLLFTGKDGTQYVHQRALVPYSVTCAFVNKLQGQTCNFETS